MKSIMYILARIFGQKSIGLDSHKGKTVFLTMYFWHGKYWVWKIE